MCGNILIRKMHYDEHSAAMQRENNQESAAYVDCCMSGLRWTIKLHRNVARNATVGGH